MFLYVQAFSLPNVVSALDLLRVLGDLLFRDSVSVASGLRDVEWLKRRAAAKLFKWDHRAST
jgi:hypothetical protein